MTIRSLFGTAAALSVSAALVFAASGAARADLTLTPSTFAAPAGSDSTEAYAISAAGLIVGDYDDGTGAVLGYLYNRSSDTYLKTNIVSQDPNAVNTVLQGVNDAGWVTGTGVNADFSVNYSSFLYNYNTDQYTTLTKAGAYRTFANDINEQNKVAIVYYNTASDFDNHIAHGAVYDIATGNYEPLDDLDTYANGQNYVGFRPQTIASNGDVVGNAIDAAGLSTGVIVRSGVATFLSGPGTSTYFNAITGTNIISGETGDDNTATYSGFVYDLNTGQSSTLDYPGSDVVSTSLLHGHNDNTLVGNYITGDGLYHNMVVSISSVAVPEPSALALFVPAGIGAAWMLVRRRRTASSTSA